MPDGFKFPTAEELKGKVKRPPIPQIQPDQDSSTIWKVLGGEPLTGFGQEAQFEHNIRNRRLNMPEFDPTGMAGTTKYITGAARTPSAWLRGGGTANFLNDMMELFPRENGLLSWHEIAANKLIKERMKGGVGKPIVAAHMRPMKYTGSNIPKETSYSTGAKPGISRKYKVQFNPEAVNYPNDVDESVFREAAKTAQRLGNPNIDKMSRAWEEVFGRGLGRNPFDYSVDIIAKRKLDQMSGVPRSQLMKPVKALDIYRQGIEATREGSEMRRILEEAMKRR